MKTTKINKGSKEEIFHGTFHVRASSDVMGSHWTDRALQKFGAIELLINNFWNINLIKKIDLLVSKDHFFVHHFRH